MTDTDLSEIHRTLGRIEGKQDAFVVSQATQDTRLGEHGSRLNKLENRQSWFLGIGAAIAAGITAAWQLLKP